MGNALSTLQPFLVPSLGLAALLRSPRFSSLARANLRNQVACFALCAHLPAALTGRMAYVDVAGWCSSA